jgi:ribonuclease J
MVVLTFYGGVDAIGGNKVLYETYSWTVLLDFGRRMAMTGSYYSEFLQIRSKNALKCLIIYKECEMGGIIRLI